MATARPFGFPGTSDPFRELRRLQDEVGRLADALAPAGALTAAVAGGFPAVNVYAGRDGIAVVAELPGSRRATSRSTPTATRSPSAAPAARPRRTSRPTTGASAGAAPSPARSSSPTGSTQSGSRRGSRTGCCG